MNESATSLRMQTRFGNEHRDDVYIRHGMRALFSAPERPSTTDLLKPRLPHYVFRRVIGRGDQTTVYLAEDKRQNRQVAIKLHHDVRDRESRTRFRNEAICASRVHHPNIVEPYLFVKGTDADAIIMEYVPGKTLDHLIPVGGLPVKTALVYAIQVAQAVTAIHLSEMIMRDLKPSNVIVTRHDVVKVLDFGLAKKVKRQSSRALEKRLLKTQRGTLLGTIAYMSPEQARGEATDARSDIFSFGAMLYELLTGARAFRRSTDLSTMQAILYEDIPLHSKVSAPLARLLQRCLAKEKARRFRNGLELVAELARVTGPACRGEMGMRKPDRAF